VSGTFHRRVGVLFATAAAALGVWKWVPGTEADRAVFETVASGLVNGPLFVSGDGSAASPWGLRAFVAEVKQDKKEAPVVVSLGDDPDGVFKSSPAAPIDMAVIFSNFQRLGATKAATAAVLAWEAPDAAELASLELVLDRFDALAMAAPLSRGPVPSPMPPAFRRASAGESDSDPGRDLRRRQSTGGIFRVGVRAARRFSAVAGALGR
jgi:hypothetical protein